MTDADNGMTAIEVEVFLTLVVPYLAALTFTILISKEDIRRKVSC